MQLKIKAVAASFFNEMQEIVGLYARGIQIFSSFSCMFLNPNIFFQFASLLFWFIRYEQEQVKKHSVTKNGSDLSLFEWIVLVTQYFCQFSAFSLEFQTFFLITRTIFSYGRSEQFWQQNTIVLRYVDWNKIYHAYKSIVFIQFWHNYFFMFTISDISFLIN